MKPDKQEKDYPDVIITKVWEKIPTDDYIDTINPNGTPCITRIYHHHLVTREVSNYIRKLEDRIKQLENE